MEDNSERNNCLEMRKEKKCIIKMQSQDVILDSFASPLPSLALLYRHYHQDHHWLFLIIGHTFSGFFEFTLTMTTLFVIIYLQTISPLKE